MLGILEPGHLILILLAALIVFGPRKLPELGKSLGESLREFRKSTSSVSEEFSRSLAPQPLESVPVAGQSTAQIIAAQPESVTPAPTVKE